MACENGDPIQFEFNSADATAGTGLLRLRAEGGVSRALAPTERFIIRAFTGSIAAAVLNAVIFDSADATVDNDEILAVLGLGSSSGNGLEQAAAVGRVPRVKAAIAGQVYIAGHGVIVNG